MDQGIRPTSVPGQAPQTQAQYHPQHKIGPCGPSLQVGSIRPSHRVHPSCRWHIWTQYSGLTMWTHVPGLAFQTQVPSMIFGPEHQMCPSRSRIQVYCHGPRHQACPPAHLCTISSCLQTQPDGPLRIPGLADW